MPFADVNDQHIYFEDSGGRGPAVIFSHGFLMDHEMFAPQVAALCGDVPLHHLGRARLRSDRGPGTLHLLGLGR